MAGKTLEVLAKATREAGTKLKTSTREDVYNGAKKARQMILDAAKSNLEINGNVNQKGERLIIDPLDSEINYKRRISNWAIHTGVFNNEKLIAGTIYLPENDIMITIEDESTRINGTKITFDNVVDRRNALVAVHTNLVQGISRKGRKPLIIDEITQEYGGLRLSGSIGADIGAILRGEVDLIIVQNPDELMLIGLNALLGAQAKTNLASRQILPQDLPIGIVKVGRIEFE